MLIAAIDSIELKDDVRTFEVLGGKLSGIDIANKLNDPEDFLIQVAKNTPDMRLSEFRDKEIPREEIFKPYSEYRENIINELSLETRLFYAKKKFDLLRKEISEFCGRENLELVDAKLKGGNPKNAVWILTYQELNNDLQHRVVFKYCAPVFPNKKRGQVENEQFLFEILKLLKLDNAGFMRSEITDKREKSKLEEDRAGAFYMNFISGKNSDEIEKMKNFQNNLDSLIIQFATLAAISDVFGKTDRRPNFFGKTLNRENAGYHPMDGQYRISEDFVVYPFDNDYLWEDTATLQNRVISDAEKSNTESSILLFSKNLQEDKQRFKKTYLNTIKTLRNHSDKIIEIIHSVYNNSEEKVNMYKYNLDFCGKEEWIDKILDQLNPKNS